MHIQVWEGDLDARGAHAVVDSEQGVVVDGNREEKLQSDGEKFMIYSFDEFRWAVKLSVT